MDKQTLYVIGAILFGTIITTFYFKVGNRLIKSFFKTTKLIKSYWIFVIIFVFICLVSYWLILTSNMQSKDILISVANQASGLVFAIFTGYFAFSQITESRFEKLRNDGREQLIGKNYTECEKSWETALAIKRKDHDTLSELSEVYMITGRYSLVEENIKLLQKLMPPEKIEIPSILTFEMRIIQGRVKEAKELITEIIRQIRAKKDTSYMPRWQFSEVKGSPAYNELVGESKTLFDNLTNYIESKMTEEHKVKFESGNYLLN